MVICLSVLFFAASGTDTGVPGRGRCWPAFCEHFMSRLFREVRHSTQQRWLDRPLTPNVAAFSPETTSSARLHDWSADYDLLVLDAALLVTNRGHYQVTINRMDAFSDCLRRTRGITYPSRPVSASLLVVLDALRQNQQVLQSGMHGFGRTREGVSVPDVAWVAALGETVKQFTALSYISHNISDEP